jgi:IstB-like ATP binding protein
MTSTDNTSLTAPATAEAASRYQRLRGHLAALKLHAAAEALPGVLNEAVTEQLSLTAALERLLAIEVAENEARRLAGRLRFASLPTPATLAGFDVDAASGVDASSSMSWPPAAIWNRPPTFCWSAHRVPARPTWRWDWRGPPPTPATAPTSPPPPIWGPAATAPPSRAAGPPPCASTRARRCSSLMNWATFRCPTRLHRRCFRLSRNDI